jgi:hypothetical protein
VSLFAKAELELHLFSRYATQHTLPDFYDLQCMSLGSSEMLVSTTVLQRGRRPWPLHCNDKLESHYADMF